MNLKFLLTNIFQKTVSFLCVMIFAAFMVINLSKFYHTLNLLYAVKFITSLIIAVLFITRRSALTNLASKNVVLVTLVSLISPLLFHYSSFQSILDIRIVFCLCVLGLLFSALALIDLGNSFGVLPANRGIKSSGVYSIVRHPIYLGYLIVTASWTVYQFTVWNLTILFLFITSTVWRIIFEEIHLSQDVNYLNYKSKVKFRLIPWIF